MLNEFPAPVAPKHDEAQRAFDILRYAHDTAESMLETFTDVRTARKAKGTPTDEEQDLLRAMVVFAGAGVDAMTKQLVRDALPVLLERSPESRTRIERLVARHLQRSSGDEGDGLEGNLQAVNPRRIAKVLLAESPRAGVAELLVDDLTAGSLQSADELYRIADYLGLKKGQFSVADSDLREVFKCRNRLIHELDIDFSQPNRNRFPRRREDMVKYARELLTVSQTILTGVDGQL